MTPDVTAISSPEQQSWYSSDSVRSVRSGLDSSPASSGPVTEPTHLRGRCEEGDREQNEEAGSGPGSRRVTVVAPSCRTGAVAKLRHQEQGAPGENDDEDGSQSRLAPALVGSRVQRSPTDAAG